MYTRDFDDAPSSPIHVIWQIAEKLTTLNDCLSIQLEIYESVCILFVS